MQEALHNCAATILESAYLQLNADHKPSIRAREDNDGYWTVHLEGEHSLSALVAAEKSLKALQSVAGEEPVTIAVTI